VFDLQSGLIFAFLIQLDLKKVSITPQPFSRFLHDPIWHCYMVDTKLNKEINNRAALKNIDRDAPLLQVVTVIYSCIDHT